MATDSARGEWIRVTRREPCPVCKHAQWCTRSADGTAAKCMRVESSQAINSGGWVHKLSDPLPEMKPPREHEPPPTREQLQHLAQSLNCNCDLALKELAGKLGVAKAVLDLLMVGYGSEDTWRGRRWFWSFPERTAQLKVVGVLRRYRDGAKFHMRGGKRGLYVVENWWRPRGRCCWSKAAATRRPC